MEYLSEAAFVLRALSAPERKRIIRLLDERHRNTEELCAELNLNEQDTSKHLNTLCRARFVYEEFDQYYLDYDQIDKVNHIIKKLADGFQNDL